MSGKHPPPPTKFGPGGIQTRSAGGSCSPRPAQPPTMRFGAGSDHRPATAGSLSTHVAQQKRSIVIASPDIHWPANASAAGQTRGAPNSRTCSVKVSPIPVRHPQPLGVQAKTGRGVPPHVKSIHGHALSGGTNRTIAPLPALSARGAGSPAQMKQDPVGGRRVPPPAFAPVRGQAVPAQMPGRYGLPPSHAAWFRGTIARSTAGLSRGVAWTPMSTDSLINRSNARQFRTLNRAEDEMV